MAQSSSLLASEVLQDDFEKLSKTVKTDFATQKENQEIQNSEYSEMLNSLDTRIDRISHTLFDLKDAYDKTSKECKFRKKILENQDF